MTYPKVVKTSLKFIKTFSFRSTNAIRHERSMLDYTDVCFQVPFPWQDRQWLARQYTAQATPRYTYLLEMQDRPKGQGPSAGASSICLTVYGIR